MKFKVSILVLFVNFFGFSQKTLDKYQPPQTIADPTAVIMKPGFHANSNDGNYGSTSFIAKIGDPLMDGTNPPIVHSPSSGENYIYTRAYLYPTTTSDAYVPQIRSITYFDGLGRAKQSIGIKASPTGEDLVTHIPYDGFGRQVDSWLPAPMSSLNGGIQSNPESAATSFHGSFAYSHKNLENSPLDRIMGLVQPGSSWQNNPITYDYLANEANEVLKFVTTTTWQNEATKSTLSLSSVYYYPQSTLYKNKVVDEDGNISYEFKNGQGQTLLVRKMNGTEELDTYYVYNEYDQLAYVLSPLAMQAIKFNLGIDLSDEGNLIKKLSYLYRYDSKNRLVEKRLPGKDWEYMVYDKADRLILTQDAKLRETNPNRWMLTKYDKFGRIVYTGFITDSNRIGMQNQIKNLVIIEDRGGSGFGKNGLQVDYSNNFFTSFDTLLSVNYYDTYPDSIAYPSTNEVFDQKLLTDYYSASAQNPNALVSTKGLATASHVKNIENNGWTKTYSFYDQQARPIFTRSINHLGGFTEVASLLDFSGVVLKTNTKHKRASTTSSLGEVNISERFVYDNQNRLKEHYHNVNNLGEELLTRNTYDALARLKSKTVGNGMETMEYKYNIRGWMTDINDTSNMGNKLFAYKINYNDDIKGLVTPNVDFPNLNIKKKYNGNIAEIEWKSIYNSYSDIPPQLERQGFVYDGVNRLLAGFYQDPNSASSKSNSEVISYDFNGNIKTLKRTGHRVKGKVAMIDNLSYTYDGNRVTNIDDLSSNSLGYEGGNGLIEYDLNGNMIIMPDKKITDITYNFLSLPTQITQPNKTTYQYRADGVKLSKKFTAINTSGMTSITTEYLDGFHYTSGISALGKQVLETEDLETIKSLKAGQVETFETPEIQIDAMAADNPGTEPLLMSLKFFPTSEGFYDFEKKQYIYQYKDHLGNSRLSFSKDSAGVLKVVDYNNYYPFGLSFSEMNAIYDVQGSPHNYKYNGKELQETGMYDYGARFYMPDIGRWPTMDGKGELYLSKSPYSYANNTPVNAIDPDGNLVIFINGLCKTGECGNEKYWRGDQPIGYLKVGENGPWTATYKSFDIRASRLLDDSNRKYVDGSMGGFVNLLSGEANFQGWNLIASNRITAGYEQGLREAKEIINQLERDTTTGEIIETIKIITHSMGGAFGKGYVKALKEYISTLPKEQQSQIKIEFEADFAPYQPLQQQAVNGVPTYQFSHNADGIAGDDKMPGAIPMDTSSDKNQTHWILDFMQQLQNLPAGNYKVVNGKIVPSN